MRDRLSPEVPANHHCRPERKSNRIRICSGSIPGIWNCRQS